MFLALNELLKEKARFALITFVIVLVSYLVFFLLALAFGLATSYTQAIEKWDADGIELSESANGNIGRSIITQQHYGDLLATSGDTAAALGVGAATLQKDESADVALFGIDADSFIAPNITRGQGIAGDREVVISEELAGIDIAVGDSITLQGDDTAYTVVGTTNNASFQTTPVIYMSLENWRDAASAASGMTGMRDTSSISAIVTRGDTRISEDLEYQSIQDFIYSLPGYQAQVLTFSLMIGFLIGIAAFVLAIFIYILTLQKKEIFGVLKAEGVPNRYIANSVIIQVGILSIGGLAVGMGLALLTGIFIAGSVPFAVNPLFFAGVSALFLLCVALGALASVRSVTTIDPVEAIG